MRLFTKIGLLGRSALCFMFVAGTIAFTPIKASAASFSIDFCDVNSDECDEDNLTEASLTFDEILSGDDPNDYTVTMTLVGTGDTTIDQVSFSIDGVQTPAGYESRPTVDGPGATDPWSVFYDNVNNATSCQSDGGSQEVCANQTDFTLGGPSIDGTNTWTWFVNLADGDDPFVIGPGTKVNLRAHFLTAEGGSAGNFSPDGGTFTTTTEVTTTTEITTVVTTTEGVPEPTLLTLLGAGLAGVSLRLRRRKAV